MGRTKGEPWIDKNHATTYKLVHRSQKDPLQADPESSKRVLVDWSLPKPAAVQKAPKTKRQRLQSHGVYFDDDYDYEQHLREPGEFSKVSMEHALDKSDDDDDDDIISIHVKPVLPKEALPSTTELEVGLLNLAAPVSGPRTDWDPDVMAALDSDNEDFFQDKLNQLDDDFILLADDGENAEGLSDNDEGADFISERRDSWLRDQAVGVTPDDQVEKKMPQLERLDEDDELAAEADLSGFPQADVLGTMPDFLEEETKTRFTNYSMSSSVIRRNKGLTLLDDKFEQSFAEYNEDELGALDHEDIDGAISTTGPLMDSLLEKFAARKLNEAVPENAGVDQQFLEGSESDSLDFEDVEVSDDNKEQKWDAESILSTYSNLYNHPKLIDEPWRKPHKIQLSKRLGVPLEGFPSKGFRMKDLGELNRDYEEMKRGAMSVTSTKSTWHFKRDKALTPEEKRARKHQLKAERKERRIEKKNTKVAFKNEEAMQKQQKINQKNTLQGLVIV